jgi:hypothetical protein
MKITLFLKIEVNCWVKLESVLSLCILVDFHGARTVDFIVQFEALHRKVLF